MSSSRRRGMTLVELAIGVAVLSVVTLVIAGLFKAGILSYNFTLGQIAALSSARKALEGDGPAAGVLARLREGAAVGALDSGSLTVEPPAGSPLSFSMAGTVLRASDATEARDQAKGVGSLQFAYYNLDERGRIMESTAAASAVFVTAAISLEGPRGKPVRFFSGAALRNHR